MIFFFRKIRQLLLKENRFKRYLVYAFGEIVLVVIGILIALQINNWNLYKSQDEQFNIAIEQIYTNLHCDVGWQKNSLVEINQQEKILDQLLNGSFEISDKKLPHVINYLDINPEKYNASPKYMIAQLQFKQGDVVKNSLVNQINSYYNAWEGWNELINSINQQYISVLFLKNNIPVQNETHNISHNHFLDVDTTFFSKQDIEKVKLLIRTPEFKAGLKSIQAKINRQRAVILNRIEDGLSLTQLIEKFKPDVHLLFDDIGIIGTATEMGWNRSIEMKQSDQMNSIWEIETELNDGFLKFRNRNSWNQNWGGSNFPSGEALFFGANIPVKKGKYHITLNLKQNQYSFNRIAD